MMAVIPGSSAATLSPQIEQAMLFIRKMKTFLNLIPGLSHDTTLSLSLAAFSFMIYLSNFRTKGSGDTVPASLLPITLLTEGSIYFDSYAQHYEKNGNPVYFFHHTRGRTVSSYPLATGFLATPIYAIPVLGWKIIHDRTPHDLSRFFPLHCCFYSIRIQMGNVVERL